jgi:hypothetical protein
MRSDLDASQRVRKVRRRPTRGNAAPPPEGTRPIGVGATTLVRSGSRPVLRRSGPVNGCASRPLARAWASPSGREFPTNARVLTRGSALQRGSAACRTRAHCELSAASHTRVSPAGSRSRFACPLCLPATCYLLLVAWEMAERHSARAGMACTPHPPRPRLQTHRTRLHLQTHRTRLPASPNTPARSLA